MTDLSRRRMFALAAGGVAHAGLAGARPASTGRGGRAAASNGIRFVEVNGTRLGYERHAGGGRPLVFVHGYALRGTGAIYADLIERLTTDFDVYALDMRGTAKRA